MRKKALKILVQYYQRDNAEMALQAANDMEYVIKTEARADEAEATLRWIIEGVESMAMLIDNVGAEIGATRCKALSARIDGWKQTGQGA